MSEENVIVDVEAKEVTEEEVKVEEEQPPKIPYKQRKAMEEARTRTINKMLKDYRRRTKNPLTIVKNMDK